MRRSTIRWVGTCGGDMGWGGRVDPVSYFWMRVKQSKLIFAVIEVTIGTSFGWKGKRAKKSVT